MRCVTFGTLRRYVPVDVSEAALLAAGRRVRAAYPGLIVLAVVSDFEEHLGLPAAEGPRLVAFLGGTIGNLEPAERAEFLASLRAGLGSGDSVLLGTDLVKDPATLVAAYDDAAGVTAAFNKNVLNVLNRELDADFDLDAFEHVAVWDSASEWIEMRLRSLTEQTVKLGAPRHRTWRSPRARRCAPRSRRSSARKGSAPSLPGPGCRCGPGGQTRKAGSLCRFRWPSEELRQFPRGVPP